MAQKTIDFKNDILEPIASLKEDLGNKITKFYASNQGETHLADSDNGKIQDMMLYGKSSQDGTPTPDNPVEIKSVVNPTMSVCGSNILQKNRSFINPLKFNGNVTLNDDESLSYKGSILDSYSIVYSQRLKLKKGTYQLLASQYSISNNLGAKLIIDKASGVQYILNNNPFVIDADDTPCRFFISCESVTNHPIAVSGTVKVALVYSGSTTDIQPYIGKSVTLPYTLNAIPVSSGGNITIDGQQYIADYVDVERGKLVRMVDIIHPKSAVDMSQYAGKKENVTNYRVKLESVDKKEVLSNMLPINRTIWLTDVAGMAVFEYDAVDFTLPYEKLGINSSANFEQRERAVETWLKSNDLMFMCVRRTSNEIDLTLEEVQVFKALATYYSVTNISINSEQLDGYTVFNYPISLANGWNYVKQQLGDTRDYIYDMDAKAQDIDIQSAEAYVNSEYAVTLTELEV